MTALRDLKPGWDSYGAPAIDPEAIRRAEAFVRLVTEKRANLVPMSSGGVSVEFYGDGDVEFGVYFEPTLDSAYLYLAEGDESELGRNPT
jgi:hypothetical protein